MKNILFIFLLLFSSFCFSSEPFIVADIYSTADEISNSAVYCANKAASYKPSNPMADWYLEDSSDMSPYTGTPRKKCMVSTQPCDPPEMWYRLKKMCKVPCEQKDLGSITTQTHLFLTCVGDCYVEQVGLSNCVGTSGDGYCTANYRQTGEFCPSSDPNPPICSDCSPGDGGGTTGGGDTGGGDTGGGDTGGGTTGGGSTGGGDSGGSGSSSSSGSGDTGNTGNTGNTGGGGSGDSGSDSALTKTDLLHVLGQSDHGDTCDTVPTCTAESSTVCNQLLQEYYLRCPHNPLHAIGDGSYSPSDHHLNIAARLQNAKDRYGQKISQLQSDLSTQLHTVVSGGGNLSCPVFHIFGVDISSGICPLTTFFDRLGGLFPAIASVLAAYIILRRE